MTTGNNRYGRAGRRAVPAATVIAFLDAYTYEEEGGRKRINGKAILEADQRQIRRWRNGATGGVNPNRLVPFLVCYDFTLPWFHKWCKLHRKPLTTRGSNPAENVVT